MNDETWTLESLKEHYDEKFAEFREKLDGFPQEFATVQRVDLLDSTIDSIRSDHVQRREVDEIKSSIAEGAGRRNVIMILVTSVISVALVMLTFFTTDRQNFQEQIHHNEQQINQLQLQIIKLQDAQKGGK